MTTLDTTDNDALRDAYRDRLVALTAIRKAFESSDATDYEKDFLLTATTCLGRTLDAWAARTGARKAWEDWIYPATALPAAKPEATEASEAAQ